VVYVVQNAFSFLIKINVNHFINGNHYPPNSNQYADVTNPCTGEVVGTYAVGNPHDVQVALESAAAAFKLWKKRPMAERAKIQHRIADLMRENADELAHILCLELGRPLAGCVTEIQRSAELLDYYAEEALRMKGELPMTNVEGEQVMVVRQPVGVVVAITPFNYPITLLTFKLGAALMMGCTVVAKPSEDTPLSTLRLATLFTEGGLPDGVFNVVTGFGAEIGKSLISNDLVAKIAFTGGTSTGKLIAQTAASLNKRITLELGGQSPAIVCKDADLTKVIPALVRHAFSNSGQFCYRVNRIYVQKEIYDTFLDRFCEGVDKLTVGNDLKKRCDLGPLVNEKIFRNSEIQVADAHLKNAKILRGGTRLTGSDFDLGWYFPPTVIADTDHSMLIMKAETFGPVVGIMPFSDNEEALNLANDTDYGLAAYVFSKDLGTALRLVEQIDAGSVWVNDIFRSHQNVPFGGMKQSGIGREKGRYGLEAYTELKTIYLNY
jgi:succinate-semialdehyde dehydrogenase / glutarate-semialdehyde dehydrogenase